MLYFILVILILIIITLCFYIYMKAIKRVYISSRHFVGKVVLVTGGTSGIGYETAVDLAERGARVLIASNERRGESVRDAVVARSGNSDVHFMYLDLSSLDSVRAFVTNILENEKRLDILINNAGVIDIKNEKSKDGFPIGMQVNYLGPFLLTKLLLPLITKASHGRIINVSSIAYKYGCIDLDNLNKTRSGCLSSFLTYCDSKLCVALMTVELDRRLRGTGVTANFLHPGCVSTNIFMHMPFANIIFAIVNPFLITPRQGAHCSIYLAVSSDVENVSGCYFENCKVKEICQKARDKEEASSLWNITERIVYESQYTSSTSSNCLNLDVPTEQALPITMDL